MSQGLGSYRSRVGNMGERPKSYRSRVRNMGEGPRSYRSRVRNVYRYSSSSTQKILPETCGCIGLYRPPLKMRGGDDHTHCIYHTGCSAQSPRFGHLRPSQKMYQITNIHTLRSGIGNRSAQEHMSISPRLEVDNEIQKHWWRVPCSSDDGRGVQRLGRAGLRRFRPRGGHQNSPFRG